MKLKPDHKFDVGDEFLINGTHILRVLEIGEKHDTVGYEVEFKDTDRPKRIDARYRDRLIEAINAEKKVYFDSQSKQPS